MKWKYRTVKEVNGGSLSRNLVEVARALNHNAYVLREAIQKIEELSIEVDRLKTQLAKENEHDGEAGN